MCAQEGSRAPNAKHPDNLATGGDFDSGTTYGGQYVPKVGPSLLPSLCNGGLGAGTTNNLNGGSFAGWARPPFGPDAGRLITCIACKTAGGFACPERQAR